MKKFYLTLWMLFTALGFAAPAQAQDLGELTLATSKEYGENLTLYPKTASKSETIYVDWGDGERKSYNIDPNGMPFFSKVSGKLLSDTIRIYADLVSLDCAESQITYLAAKNLPKMQILNATGNQLTTDNLDLDGAENLENLDLSNNDLSLLNISEFQFLQILNVNDNPRLGAVMFPEYSETLKSVSMSNCDISRFHPIDLPVLTSLTIRECALMDLEIGNHYPLLESLDVTGNYISELDVSDCPNLHTLKCGNNQLVDMNVGQNTELLNFFCENNKIKELNLQRNAKITSLSCDHNDLDKLDVSYLPNLYRLSCDSNKLTRLDLSHNPVMNRLTCKYNLLEFLDFAGNPRIDYIDCRFNSKMTSNTVNYMFSTILARYRDAWSPNLLVEGCNAEHADMSEINTPEMKWKTDVIGDGTAKFEEIKITSLPSEHGTYVLSQPTEFGKVYEIVHEKAMTGTPIKVTSLPAQGYIYDYTLVNGETVSDSLFVVEENAEIEVFFKSNKYPQMTLGTIPNTEISFAISAPAADTRITIDWGDGFESTHIIGQTLKRFDGVAHGTKIVIKGNVSVADFSSYPEMGIWDNKFNSLDLDFCENIESLTTYMNPIQTLDVSECPNLKNLDCSYCELNDLKLNDNDELESLRCYGNHISALDVSKCPNLVILDVKSNQLTDIDLSNNEQLEYLSLQDNKLTDIDVSNLEELAQLFVGYNQLSKVDVTENEELFVLNVEKNMLKELDLSENEELGMLFCGDNQISSLDFSEHEYIYYIDCSGNKMTAEALTDMYYTLPVYPELTEPLKSFSLWVKGTNPETANDAEHAESILASGKGWTINYEGDGSGCENAYVTIIEPKNGEIEVFTADGEEVDSGTKVKKNTELTIKATPNEGFELSRLTANGEEVEDDKFVITRSTDVAARFNVWTGIDEVENADSSCLVEGGNCMVNITTDSPVKVSVYTADGKLIKQETMLHDGNISVPTGTYVIKTEAGNRTNSKVILVR